MSLGGAGMYICLFLALYFEVFLLISFLERKPGKKTSLKPKRYPSVSMIVPCFNEGKTLAATISSLLTMEYPKDKLEIVVVDDGSTDNTREIGEEWAKRSPQVTYFYKENGGKYTALNFAITRSSAEFVGCLDADSFADPDALTEVIKKFEEDTSVVAIVPVMKVHNARTLLETMQMAEYTFGIFVKKIFDNLGAISVLPGPFSIYRRDVFDMVGPFKHAHNTEDMEIAFRIQKHGLKIANAHTAFVYTTVPSTVRTLVKQRTRWTQGYLQNAMDYWYMFGNPKFGNFGLFVLPLGIALFFGALYMTSFMLWHLIASISHAINSALITGIMPQLSWPKFDWFYIDTRTSTFVIVATLLLTIVGLIIGKRIANAKFGIPSVVYYIVLYGLISPLWLVRALWGTILARESAWR